MRSNHVIKINALGGIFTPLKLKSIVEIAFSAEARNINFGPRQEIFFNIHTENLADFEIKMKSKKFEFEVDKDEHPNIISSYPAEGIFSDDNWLSEGIYKDVFDQFSHYPKLKINICDIGQCLVPLFSGEINFIASPTYQYWYLFLNLKEHNSIIQWNKLIYSTDIPKVCLEIEELYLNNRIIDPQTIITLVNENTTFLSLEVEKELELPRFVFPYYEGMNRYGNKYWMGIYRRDYMFPIPFIFELCELCISSDIGQLCITPWRTLIIKGIEQKDRIQWEKLLGKHRINLRHSTNELNWVVEDINSLELGLKKYIASQFDQKDIRTFGLVFGIKTESSNYIPASIIIEEIPNIRLKHLKLLSNYNIYHTDNFNPNTPVLTPYAKSVSKSYLPAKLLDLCKKYYETLNETEPVYTIEVPKVDVPLPNIFLYQCKHCFTVYDERYGDQDNNINAGVVFNLLPNTYTCPTCESPKSDYILISSKDLIQT